MECTINDFIALRRTIIQNEILNKLLLAALSRRKTSDTLSVATTYLPPKYETVKRFNENGTPLSTKCLLYDIVVQNDAYYGRIGVRYPGQPIIWGSRIVLKDFKDITKLKFITHVIFESYPIQSKEVLKQYPSEFKDFLEASQIPIEAWENGTIKILPEPQKKSSDMKIEAFQAMLEKNLSDYRILNLLLIQLFKNYRRYKLQCDSETLNIIPSTMNESFLFDYQNAATGNKRTELLYLYELTPSIYNAKLHKIPLSLIQKFLDNGTASASITA